MVNSFFRKNNGESSATTIIAIFIAIIIMVGLPLIFVAGKQDQAVIQEAQAIVTRTVNNWASEGVITQEKIDNLVLELTSLGRAYDAEIEIQSLDENSAKKSGDFSHSGTYITRYTTQVLDDLKDGSPIRLNAKDTITVRAEPKDESIADQLGFSSAKKGVAQATAMVPNSTN